MSELERLCVVLVATRNPLNLGAAARAMSNFGFSCLRVVAPYEAAFREARSAVGASELLASAQEYGSVAEAVADCALVVGTTAARHRQLVHPLLTLEQGARLIRQELLRLQQTQQRSRFAGPGTPEGHVALLFGSEKRGLSNRDLSHCHWLLHMPTREEHASMNLGQAVAVCLYELARASSAPALPAVPTAAAGPALSAPKPNPASAAELERITAALLEALRASGYPHAQTAAAEEKVRRLVRRLDADAADSETLLGMLRQILWKLGAGE
ncbi:MAG: TrmH family RNA methyltransferase [Candidatus Korobacteraceae bacterium]|jgi:tRNA/rRNA methyltransferase